MHILRASPVVVVVVGAQFAATPLRRRRRPKETEETQIPSRCLLPIYGLCALSVSNSLALQQQQQLVVVLMVDTLPPRNANQYFFF